ncbi:hypothetical protein HMI55_003297 [Coelomomyces lativittatus]|nr:hypothetical protein HMI55_003297 [Coelomomyces lativittatus]
MSGILPPHSETELHLTFSPNFERKYSAQLLVHIKKKQSPLTLHLYGEGYSVNASMKTEPLDGFQEVEILARSEKMSKSIGAVAPTNVGNISTINSKPPMNNILNPNSSATKHHTTLPLETTLPLSCIDLGRIQIGETKRKKLWLSNHGPYQFDFTCKSLNKFCKITPDIGTVAPKLKEPCELWFSSDHPVTFENQAVAVCSVMNGPYFYVFIHAQVLSPKLHIFPTSLDFGTCFSWRAFSQSMPPIAKSLMIKNEDLIPLAIEVSSTQPTLFSISDQILKTLSPQESIEFKVSFFPAGVQTYHADLLVDINGMSQVKVPIQGVGCELSVGLLKPDQRHIQFGSVRPGQKHTRQVKIVNRSLFSVDVTIGGECTREFFVKNCVKVIPDVLTMKPKSIIPIQFEFEPLYRIPVFTEEVHLVTMGQKLPFCFVTAAALGVEMKLETDLLVFGPVTCGSAFTKKVILTNVGDIGVSFRWDSTALLPDFTICPLEGYLSPGMHVALEVTFRPIIPNPDVKNENIPCHVESMQEPLFLSLTGICIPLPIAIDTLKFNTSVRIPETKSITLVNKTNFKWNLAPVIDHSSFTGNETVIVDPSSSLNYDVTFLPLELNAEYNGTVFFPLPDGSGLLYKVTGTVEKPFPCSSIQREILSKKNHCETLSVTNWLKKTL